MAPRREGFDSDELSALMNFQRQRGAERVWLVGIVGGDHGCFKPELRRRGSAATDLA
jgi:hypothetical protein